MIKLQTFIDYLERNGWRRPQHYDPSVIIYCRAKGDFQEIVQLPGNETRSDYPIRIRQALQRLADCEEISYEKAFAHVTGEMLLSAEDIIGLLRQKMEECAPDMESEPEDFDIINNQAIFIWLEDLLEYIKEWNDRLM